MVNYDSLLSQASQLPAAQRIQLIEALWDTVAEEDVPPLSDEWIAEIQRRSAEFDAGKVETIPWEKVRAEALQRAGINDSD